MKDQTLDYQELEFTAHSEFGEQKESSFVATLNRIWSRFVESIIAVNELKIYSLKNKYGVTYWRVNNLHSGRKVFLSSEAEVRAWLDRRYYD